MEEDLRAVREALAQLWTRQDAQDERLSSISADVASLRGFQDRTESELSTLRVDLSTLVEVLEELSGLPPDVRAQFDAELAGVRAELSRQTSFFVDDELIAMAGDTVAARIEAEASTAREEPSGAAPSWDDIPTAALDLQALSVPPRSGWFADAIKAVAVHRSATLAGELVLELVPFHALQPGAPLTFALQIDELGRFTVAVADGEVVITPSEDADGLEPDFRMAGNAAAFAALAGPGSQAKLPGVQVRGSRRKAKRYLSALSQPITLADLAGANIAVWPGLLLAAMAEAVAPAWTKGSRFVVWLEVVGCEAVFEVRATDGAPLAVNRPGSGATPSAAKIDESFALVSLSERGFTCLLAGIPLPDGEQVAVKGDQSAVRTLLDWFARAQAPADQSRD